MPNSCNTSTISSPASACSHENDGTNRSRHGEFIARFNLIPGHERSLAVSCRRVIRYIRQVYSLTHLNIRINEAGLPQGPAVRAGLLVGDIMTAWNEAPVERARDVMRLLGSDSVGKSVALTVLRGGAAINVNVTIGERPLN